jgi:RNA 3'-phosphate cyclase
METVGGTDVPMSPSIDYLDNVFIKLISIMGAKVDVKLMRRGHYPRGGGRAVLKVSPSKLMGFWIERRGEMRSVFGISHCTNLPSHVAERQKKSATELLQTKGTAKIETETSSSSGAGSGIVLWADYDKTVMGSSSLGKQGKRAEKVGIEAASKLMKEMSSPSTVDSHAADQLIPFVALAQNPSSYICKLTNHVKTNIYTTERILGKKFRLTHIQDGFVKIVCQNP